MKIAFYTLGASFVLVSAYAAYLTHAVVTAAGHTFGSGVDTLGQIASKLFS